MATVAEQLFGIASQTTRDRAGDLQKGAALAQQVQQIQQNRVKMEQSKVELGLKQNDNFFSALARISKAKTPAEKKFFQDQARIRFSTAQPNGNPANLDFIFADDELRRKSLASFQNVRATEAGASTEFLESLNTAFSGDTEGFENAVNEFVDQQFQLKKEEAKQETAQLRIQASDLRFGERQETRAVQQKTINTQRLRKELRADPVTKETIKLNSSFNRVQGALAGKPSAAGDLSAIFAFMKMLDPGSVVRESEFATAANAAGVPDRIRNTFNKLQRGERLTVGQRKDFLNQATKIKRRQDGLQRTINTRFSKLAKQEGLDPGSIIAAIDQPLPPEGKQVPKNLTKKIFAAFDKAKKERFAKRLGLSVVEIEKQLGKK